MKIYFAVKYHADLSNKVLIERVCTVIEKQHQAVCCHRDLEKWGELSFSAEEIMSVAFKMIESCDAMLIEFSEGGIGVGIEAGYAKAKNIPVYVMLPRGMDLPALSSTMKGICNGCFNYETDEDMYNIIEHIADDHSRRH